MSTKCVVASIASRAKWLASGAGKWAIMLVVAFSAMVGAVGGAPVIAQSSSDVSMNEINEVARELWCPLCAGVRLDGCELKACDQMKDEIAIKLAEGENLESIKSYFVAQYGPQVLGEPPAEGFNLLAWILPFVVLLGGGVFLVIRGRSLIGRRDDDEDAALAAAPNSAGPGDNAVPADPYAQRLEEELKRYD